MSGTNIVQLNDLRHSGKDIARDTKLTDYASISWVYSCVNRIALTASGAPLVFYQGDTTNENNRITDKKSDVLRLFSPPSAPQIASLRDLINRTFIHLGIRGQIFWVFSASSGSTTIDTISVRSDLKPILKDPSSGKTYYSGSGGEQGVANNETLELIGWYNRTSAYKSIEIFDPEDVLPILYYNPYDVYSGLSPLSAARISIDSEKKISNWNSAYFNIGMKNPLILKSKGTLTTEQKRELRKEVRNYYSGIEGGQGALLLGGNVEVQDGKVSSKDVDFIKGKELNREEIAAIYGVPPALIGIFNYANYANTREQRQLFWENTLLPQLNLICDLIQVNVLDRIFPGITCKWDVDAISGLSTDPVESAKAAEMYFSMGIPIEVIGNMLKLPDLASLTNDDLISPETSDEDSGAESDEDSDTTSDEESDEESDETSVEGIITKGRNDLTISLEEQIPIVAAKVFSKNAEVLSLASFSELLVSQVYSILDASVRTTNKNLLAIGRKDRVGVDEVKFLELSAFLHAHNRTIKNKSLLEKCLLDFCVQQVVKT